MLNILLYIAIGLVLMLLTACSVWLVIQASSACIKYPRVLRLVLVILVAWYMGWMSMNCVPSYFGG